MPEMVEQMENKLKNYVDKEEIDRKVKQYDLESFCNWKDSIDKEEYDEQLMTYRRNVESIFGVNDNQVRMILLSLRTGETREVKD